MSTVILRRLDNPNKSSIAGRCAGTLSLRDELMLRMAGSRPVEPWQPTSFSVYGSQGEMQRLVEGIMPITRRPAEAN